MLYRIDRNNSGRPGCRILALCLICCNLEPNLIRNDQWVTVDASLPWTPSTICNAWLQCIRGSPRLATCHVYLSSRFAARHDDWTSGVAPHALNWQFTVPYSRRARYSGSINIEGARLEIRIFSRPNPRTPGMVFADTCICMGCNRINSL